MLTAAVALLRLGLVGPGMDALQAAKSTLNESNSDPTVRAAAEMLYVSH